MRFRHLSGVEQPCLWAFADFQTHSTILGNRGYFHRAAWEELFVDELYSPLVPILALAYEHDPDPEQGRDCVGHCSSLDRGFGQARGRLFDQYRIPLSDPAGAELQ
jgi:hypothetical protein